MNSFDTYYDIRRAVLDDIPLIMEFIGQYWKENHILAVNRSFFEYEMVQGENVNFIIAVSKQTGRIEGIHGFIPASQSQDKLDVWGAIWKVVEGSKPMLGMELKKRLPKLIGLRYELGVGLNPDTAGIILNFFGYYIASMNHYYMLSKRDKYKIADIKCYREGVYKERKAYVKQISVLEELERDFDFGILKDNIPYKDAWYIRHPYFQHPIYRYKAFLVSDDYGNQAVLIVREQECFGEKVLRIVDFLGKQEVFGCLAVFFLSMLCEYEYIDFYFSGMDERYVKDAGFVKADEHDPNIIPDHFNPFEKKNSCILVTSNTENGLFFKADGDQDRPV